MLQEKPKNALKINSRRCIADMIACSLLCIFVFLAIVYNLLAQPDNYVKEVGLKTFRMFTVLSNMLMAVSAAMCIPYAVDGLRNRDYHLPRWIVNLMFTGTTGVTLTFLIALFVLSPNAGFRYIMTERANLFLHTFCPLFSMVLFLFINSDHRVPFRTSFLAILPMVLYSLVYLFMVYVLGENHGGWRDQYHFKSLMPWYFLAPLMYLLTFGIANLLRVLHNRLHRKRKENLELYYQESEEFSCADLQAAIRHLAEEDRLLDKGGNLAVPRRILLMLGHRYQSNLPVQELCKLFIDSFYAEDSADTAQDKPSTDYKPCF